MDYQIGANWGNKLIPIPAALVSDSSLPDETQRFLAKVGLPFDQLLPERIRLSRDELHWESWQDSRYLVVGLIDEDIPNRENPKLGIKEPTGEVILFDPAMGEGAVVTENLL